MKKRENELQISKKSYFEIIGLHIKKYRILMIVLCSFILAVALFLSIYWNYDENSAGVVIDNIYLASHIYFAVTSAIIILLLVLNKFNKISDVVLVWFFHIYSFLLIALATMICIFDLQLGISPFIYLIICTVIAGLFIVEPFFYIACVGSSFVTLIIFISINHYSFFAGNYGIENLANFIIYTILVILVSFRHFRVTISEYKAKAQLEKLTYYDELTGLLNERSYMIEVDKISEDIAKDNVEDFLIILMDVNNLKATNDEYGHRFGCHLIVHTGEVLPTVFKSSKLFHVGGDEFIAIVRGEDLENFDQTMELFDKTFSYSFIEFEGKQLIFSVARGFARYQKGNRYQDVIQSADGEMYINKKYLKEKYHMKSR